MVRGIHATFLLAMTFCARAAPIQDLGLGDAETTSTEIPAHESVALYNHGLDEKGHVSREYAVMRRDSNSKEHFSGKARMARQNQDDPDGCRAAKVANQPGLSGAAGVVGRLFNDLSFGTLGKMQREKARNCLSTPV